jgi:5-methylcytosine-specific restriction protein A
MVHRAHRARRDPHPARRMEGAPRRRLERARTRRGTPHPWGGSPIDRPRRNGIPGGSSSADGAARSRGGGNETAGGGSTRGWGEVEHDPVSICSEPGCPHPVVRRGRCNGHALAPWHGSKEQRTRLGVPNGRALARLRRQVRERARHRCERCSTRVPAGVGAVDHVVPVAAGGDPTSLGNLELLCTRCHDAKTRDDLALIRAVSSSSSPARRAAPPATGAGVRRVNVRGDAAASTALAAAGAPRVASPPLPAAARPPTGAASRSLYGRPRA